MNSRKSTLFVSSLAASAATMMLFCHPAAAQTGSSPAFAPASPWSVGSTELSTIRGLKSMKLPCVITTEYDNGFVVRFSGGGGQLLALAIDFRQDIFEQGRKYNAMLSIGDAYIKQVSATAFTPNTLIFNLRPVGGIYGALKTGERLEIDIDGNAMSFDLGNLAEALPNLESCYKGEKTPPPIETLAHPAPPVVEAVDKPAGPRQMSLDLDEPNSELTPLPAPPKKRAAKENTGSTPRSDAAQERQPAPLLPMDFEQRDLPKNFDDIVQQSEKTSQQSSAGSKTPPAKNNSSEASPPKPAETASQLTSSTPAPSKAVASAPAPTEPPVRAPELGKAGQPPSPMSASEPVQRPSEKVETRDPKISRRDDSVEPVARPLELAREDVQQQAASPPVQPMPANTTGQAAPNPANAAPTTAAAKSQPAAPMPPANTPSQGRSDHVDAVPLAIAPSQPVSSQPPANAPQPQSIVVPAQAQQKSNVRFNARAGEDLKIVLSRWAERAGYDLDWQSANEGKVAQDIEMTGSFEDAVTQLLAENAATSGLGGHIQADDGRRDLARPEAQAPANREPVQKGAAVEAVIPAMHKKWEAPAGANIQTVIDQWAADAGVVVVWQDYMALAVKENLSAEGRFEEAVQSLLDQFSSDKERPVARLNNDPDSGQRTLLISAERD